MHSLKLNLRVCCLPYKSLCFFVAAYGATCNDFWLYLYWINNALGSIFGILAILIALLTNVYGSGLALRGPLGSMVRALRDNENVLD
jgi:hypothetical protein